MNTHQPNTFHLKEKQKPKQKKSALLFRKPSMRNGERYYLSFEEITLSVILKKILFEFKKMLISLKARFPHSPIGIFKDMRLPWLKIGLLLFIVFIMMKKDFQFSIHMQAPTNAAADDKEKRASSFAAQDQMNLGALPVHEDKNKAFIPASLKQLDENDTKAYIKRFSKVAVAEMKKYGIPASVKMAQALIESWAGNNPYTKKSNNHFGVPMSITTYDSAWENWRAHSLFMQNDPTFKKAFKNGFDYKKWAKDLKKYNYSKDKKYDDKLIEVIEKYKLNLLDQI